MSWRASAWALKQRTGAPGPKLTLLALAAYATDADGVAWPSQQTLADVTEQSVDSIQRHVRLLERLGLISIEHRRRRTGDGLANIYRLSFSRPHLAAYEGRTLRSTDDPSRPQMAPPVGRKHPLSRPQALRHDTSLEESSSEASGPQGSKAEGTGGSLARPDGAHSPPPETEPSPGSVPKHGRSPQQEAQRLAEERKNRETYEQIKQRLGPTFGIKQMD